MKRRNRPGGGSVYRPSYKAADGTTKHQATWTIKYADGNGRSVKIATGLREKSKAQALLNTKLAEVSAASLSVGANLSTFEELVSLIVRDYKINGRDGKSLLTLTGRIKNLRAAFGSLKPSEIGPAALEGYKDTRQAEGAANATINRELKALRRMFRIAEQRGLSVRVPHVEMLTEADPRVGFFEADDFRRVVSFLPEDVRPVALVMYVTGWRVDSEVLTRQWRDVNLSADGWVRLEPGEGKTGQARNFPLIPELRSVLEAQRERVDALQHDLGRILPDVFVRTTPSGKGKPGDRIKGFRKAWATACRKAGVAGMLRHDCRRTAARNLIRAGIPQVVAMKLTGHETDSVFRRYAITDANMLREAGALLSTHLAPTMSVSWCARPGSNGEPSASEVRAAPIQALFAGVPWSLRTSAT